MSRTPVGTIRQQDSRTALFAFILCHLEGVPLNGKCEAFLSGLGLHLGYNAVKKAGGAKLRPSPHDGRGAKADAQRRDSPLRSWLLVDQNRLGLEQAWVQFPGDGHRQAELIDRLKNTPGVQFVAEFEERGDVVAGLLFDGPADRQRLRHVLREWAVQFSWNNVVFEDRTPEIGTWKALALRAARDEELV